MPRRRIPLLAGHVYHVLNRATARARLFDHDGDYRVFKSILATTLDRRPVRLFAYCVMPNHFHLVCAPEQDGQLSDFMRLLTMVHSKRWHAARGTTGTGPVYQGRFKAVLIKSDSQFLTVCRYVERNALTSRLVLRAEDWRWSSLADHWRKSNEVRLAAWPISKPRNWLQLVNSE